MPRYLNRPNKCAGTTDHSDLIEGLRGRAGKQHTEFARVELQLAADLLEAHDDTGISLDTWPSARCFVEILAGQSILPNCV